MSIFPDSRFFSEGMLFESTAHAETKDFFAHNTCRLVIFIQPLRIYFALLGPREDLVYCKEYYNSQQSVDVLFLRYAFEQEKILSHSFASIKVYIDTEFCLIPDQEEFLKERYDFARFMLNEDIGKEDIYYHPMAKSDIAGLFIPPQLWIDLLNEYLPSYELASGSELSFRLGNLLHNALKPLILIHLMDEHVNISGFKREKLEFIQRYPYRSILDLVYFIQLSSSLLHKGGKVDLYLVGEMEEESENWEELKKYFPRIKFPPSLMHRSQKDPAQSPWWKYTYLN